MYCTRLVPVGLFYLIAPGYRRAWNGIPPQQSAVGGFTHASLSEGVKNKIRTRFNLRKLIHDLYERWIIFFIHRGLLVL